MKKFLSYSILMAIILITVFTAIEFLLFLRPNIYSYKYKYVSEHTKSIKILFLGNSHIEESIIPQYIGDDVFNFAISGRRLIYDIKLAERFIPMMDSLKIVIMPLDYTSFSFGRMGNYPDYDEKESPMDKTYSCMYYKYMNVKLNHPMWMWSEILNSKLKYMVRFIESNDKCRECDSLGYVKMSLAIRLHDWSNRMLPDYIDTKKVIDKKKKETLFQQYKKVAEITQEKKSSLILLSTPMYKTYQEKMQEDIIKEMSLFYFQLKRINNDIKYYDFTKDKDFIEEDFYDSSHLSEKGAIKFSKKISSLLSKHIKKSNKRTNLI